MKLARGLVLAGVGIAVTALTVAVFAPAAWAASAIRAASGGHLELAEVSGTCWRGEATLVIASGGERQATRASVPARLSWRLSPWQLLTGTVDLTLSQPAVLNQPLTVRAQFDGSATVGAATLRLPASLLTALGAPWNTVRPGGELLLNWDNLHWHDGKLTGHVGAEWDHASSTLSPVSPFGHYRLQTNGVFPGTLLELETLTGPLELTGNGTIEEGGHLRFQGLARAEPGADPAVKNQLAGLISLLGRRDGESAILNFGS